MSRGNKHSSINQNNHTRAPKALHSQQHKFFEKPKSTNKPSVQTKVELDLPTAVVALNCIVALGHRP